MLISFKTFLRKTEAEFLNIARKQLKNVLSLFICEKMEKTKNTKFYQNKLGDLV